MQGTFDLQTVLDGGLVLVRTRQEFDTLMNALEQVGATWITGDKPTSRHIIREPEIIHVKNGCITWISDSPKELERYGFTVYDFDDLMEYDVGELSDLMNLFTDGRSDCCG